ncbi:restriction endonuclease [Nocardia nova]|uniref:restriction endonuclease n=1 Tax=Nocardia nova TaxID=37330 RepID=UPI0033D2F771
MKIVPPDLSADFRDHRVVVRGRVVRPTRYADADLRRIMGQLIGKADADELLAAYLWTAEGRIAHEVLDDVTEDQENMRKWLRSARRQLAAAEPFDRAWNHSRHELNDILGVFIDACTRELQHYAAIESAVKTQIAALRARFGSDLVSYYCAPAQADTPIEAIYRAWERTTAPYRRFEATVEAYRADVKRIAALDARRAAYVATGAGASDCDIQGYTGADLEALTSSLLERDGLRVERAGGGPRDHGADVIAVTPDQRRVVIQCKFRQSGPVIPQVVYAVNGTARPVHNADIAIIVTNSTFTKQATEFAESQSIHLIDEYKLRCWATWGDHLYELLNITPPPTDTDTEAA